VGDGVGGLGGRGGEGWSGGLDALRIMDGKIDSRFCGGDQERLEDDHTDAARGPQDTPCLEIGAGKVKTGKCTIKIHVCLAFTSSYVQRS
jgi:hypothetical protein